MSRSIVGGKPTGWEYWGKRKGSWCVDRKTSHKMERMQLKEEDREIVKDALFELGEELSVEFPCWVLLSSNSFFNLDLATRNVLSGSFP